MNQVKKISVRAEKVKLVLYGSLFIIMKDKLNVIQNKIHVLKSLTEYMFVPKLIYLMILPSLLINQN
jgi:hypothetical protein